MCYTLCGSGDVHRRALFQAAGPFHRSRTLATSALLKPPRATTKCFHSKKGIQIPPCGQSNVFRLLEEENSPTDESRMRTFRTSRCSLGIPLPFPGIYLFLTAIFIPLLSFSFGLMSVDPGDLPLRDASREVDRPLRQTGLPSNLRGFACKKRFHSEHVIKLTPRATNFKALTLQ